MYTLRIEFDAGAGQDSVSLWALLAVVLWDTGVHPVGVWVSAIKADVPR